MQKKKPLSLQEFIQKKYGNKLVDIKKANKEFVENQKNMRKYWISKKNGKEDTFLLRNLIW